MPGKNHKKSTVALHIGVIRLSAMGDVAMTLPVLLNLLNQYPHLEITFVSRPFFKPLFASLPRVHFFEIDLKNRHKGFTGLYRLYRDLKKRKITAWADLHQVMRTYVLDFLFFLSGTPLKIINKGRLEKKKLTRCRHKIFRPLTPMHQRYVAVFRDLGFEFSLADDTFLSTPSPSPITEKYVSNQKIRRIGVAPFAKFESKTYPADLMKTVLSSLAQNPDYELYLFGAPSEKEKLNTLFDGQKNIVNLAGTLSFEEEISLLAHLEVMLSMDSGNGHIAAAFGVPVVTLWGATHPYAGFAPYGQSLENALIPNREKYPCLPTSVFGKTLPENYKDCMRSIKPERVVQRVNEVLKTSY